MVSIVNSLAAGGAEKQVLLTAQMLAGYGWRVWIIALKPNPSNPRIEKLIAAAEARGVRIFRPSRSGWSWPGLLQTWFQNLHTLSSDPIVWSWGHRAEVVRGGLQVILPGAVGLVSLRSAFKAEIDRLAWLWRILDLQRPHYLSNSALNLELLQRHLPEIGTRSVIVYNAVEEHALAAPPVELPSALTRLRLMMLGNIRIKLKGYDLVVKLAVEIRRRGLPITITIGGAENEGLELRRQIAAEGVEDVVRIVGVVDSPEDFLRSGDGFLLMSRIEGMPNALIEAMCLGLPCIATKVGDLARFTRDRENIRLVEVGDYLAVADILGEWLRDWPRAAAQGTAGRELSERLFAPEVIRRQLGITMCRLAKMREPEAVI